MAIGVAPDPARVSNPTHSMSMATYSKSQKLAAEFWGTFVVVLFSAGAMCGDSFLRSASPAGAGAGGGIGAVGVALAYGLAVAGMTAALGRVSGGHFNPAVTIGFWVTRRLTTFDTVTYWAAQLGGAIAAAYLLRYLVPEAAWRAVALGAPELGSGLTRGPGMVIEGLAAFVLMIAVFSAPAGEPGRPGAGVAAALAAGVAVAMGSLFAAPFTGGAMNPARAFGPALAANHWTNQGIYWIGPLGGAVLAAWLYDALFSRAGGRT